MEFLNQKIRHLEIKSRSCSRIWVYLLGYRTLTPSTGSVRINKASESCSGRYFVNSSGSREIFKHVSVLKTIPKWKRVSIGGDLNPQQNRNRQDLKDLCALAKRREINARISGNTLMIDDKRFLHRDITNLPYNLSLADAKQVTCEDGLAFQGPAIYLSNLNKVSYEGLSFTSAEQAFVYVKALMCGALAILSCIRSVHDPFRIKSLARTIVATKEWME